MQGQNDTHTTDEKPAEVGLYSHKPFRLMDARSHELILQLQGTPQLLSGRLTLVGISAIAERFGPKWEARATIVAGHLKKVLGKEFDADLLVHPTSDTEFLVVHAGTPGAAGRVRCLSALRETLMHFLGEVTPDALRVSEVLEINDSGLVTRPLNPASLAELADLASTGELAATAQAVPRAPVAPVFARGADAVEAMCDLRPFLRLEGKVHVGYRLVPMIRFGRAGAGDPREAMTPAEAAKLQRDALAQGIERVAQLTETQRPLTLVVPVPLSSVQNLKDRAGLIALLRAASRVARHGAICELTAADDASSWMLSNAVATLKPFCLHVIVRVGMIDARRIQRIREAKVSAVSVQCPRLAEDHDFVCWLLSLQKDVGNIGKVLLDGVSSANRADVASQFGVTHVSLAVPDMLSDMPRPVAVAA